MSFSGDTPRDRASSVLDSDSLAVCQFQCDDAAFCRGEALGRNEKNAGTQAQVGSGRLILMFHRVAVARLGVSLASDRGVASVRFNRFFSLKLQFDLAGGARPRATGAATQRHTAFLFVSSREFNS